MNHPAARVAAKNTNDGTRGAIFPVMASAANSIGEAPFSRVALSAPPAEHGSESIPAPCSTLSLQPPSVLHMLAKHTIDVGGQRPVVDFRKFLKSRFHIGFKADRNRVQFFLSFHGPGCSRL